MNTFGVEYQQNKVQMDWFLSDDCVRIETITLEISFGCQPSPGTSGLVRDNQNFLLGNGSLSTDGGQD